MQLFKASNKGEIFSTKLKNINIDAKIQVIVLKVKISLKYFYLLMYLYYRVSCKLFNSTNINLFSLLFQPLNESHPLG